MDIQTREALITEINNFKKEALKMHIVEVLANTYEHSSLFDCNIDVDGSVIWYKAQARQLWGFWQAAKTQAVPESNALLSASLDAIQKLGSGDFVLVPVDTLNKALNPNDYDEAVCSANDLLAIIEAQEQSHD